MPQIRERGLKSLTSSPKAQHCVEAPTAPRAAAQGCSTIWHFEFRLPGACPKDCSSFRCAVICTAQRRACRHTSHISHAACHASIFAPAAQAGPERARVNTATRALPSHTQSRRRSHDTFVMASVWRVDLCSPCAALCVLLYQARTTSVGSGLEDGAAQRVAALFASE